MNDTCPDCKSRDTVLRHDLKENKWQSICKKCGYKSPLTKGYDNAWAWLDERREENVIGKALSEGMKDEK